VLAGFVSVQSAPELTQEGLPYWLFWLLLCIILLLLAFIFLRDKNLRRRLSSFLSGARRRISQIRLQSKLKREREKKAALWRELGKKAWSANIRAACVDRDCDKLASLDEEMHLHQMTWQEVYSRMETLGRQHEEARHRYETLIDGERAGRKPLESELAALEAKGGETLNAIKSAETEAAAVHGERARSDKRKAELKARIEAFNENIRRIEDERSALNHTSGREMKEWQKNKERLQDRITEIQRLMEPLFESMGQALDEARLSQDELADLYAQIDGVNKTVVDLHDHMERLR